MDVPIQETVKRLIIYMECIKVCCALKNIQTASVGITDSRLFSLHNKRKIMVSQCVVNKIQFKLL